MEKVSKKKVILYFSQNCPLASFSYEFLHVDVPVLAIQQKLTSPLYGHRMQSRRSTRSKR